MPVGLFLPGPGPYNARNPERGSAGAVTAALSAYQTYALSLSPSLYWSLNAVTGTTDQSGNARNGTGQAGVAVGADATSPLNGGSTSTDFDNVDDYVSSSYAPFVNATVRTFTGWAYRDSAATEDSIFWASQVAGPTLFVEPDNDVQFKAVGDSGVFATWAGAWPGTSQWVHWALVFDEPNDLATLYLNGVSSGAVAMASAYDASPGVFDISNPHGFWHWDGKLAHVGVWERALTPTEVANLYASRLIPAMDGLTSAAQSSATLALTTPLPAYQTYALSLTPSLYWALNATTGATDLSGNGRNGAGGGGVTVGANATSPLNGGSASTDLDGSDDRITTSYVPYVNGTAITTAGWLWLDDFGAAVVPFGSSHDNIYPLRIDTDGSLIWGANDSTTSGYDTAPGGTWATTGAWVHVAVVMDTSTGDVKLYFNGSLVDSLTILGGFRTYTASGQTFVLGTRGASLEPFDGKMAHVAVWERVLTPTEIANLYASRLIPGIESLTSAGQSSATLALSAPAKVTLATAAAQSAATLSLTAPAKVTLATSAAISSATLALSAPTQVPLATAACVASATCAVSIPSAAVEVPLATAAAQSSATLALSAPALTTLQSSAAVSSATLALTAKPTFTLTAAATSSATLALRAETRITLGTSACQASATLALTAPTRVVLGTAAATSAATLALSAPTRVVLGSAAAQSAATLSLTAPTRVTLGTAATQSSATLALTATTQIPLQTSAAVASATLGLTAGGAPVPLATAAAICAATLSLKALTQIPLAPSAAQSSATLAVTVATRVVLQTSAGVSSATLSVSRPERVTLGAAAAVSSASLSVVILSPTPDTNPDLGGDVEENATGGEVEEVLTGGTPVANITGGIPVATVTSGIVNEVLTGGIYDEVLTGGEPDDTTGGDLDLVSTGGDVNVVLTGGVVNEVLTGGTYDETLTGGDVQEVPTGDSPDESERGGDYDLVLTGGEVL